MATTVELLSESGSDAERSPPKPRPKLRTRRPGSNARGSQSPRVEVAVRPRRRREPSIDDIVDDSGSSDDDIQLVAAPTRRTLTIAENEDEEDDESANGSVEHDDVGTSGRAPSRQRGRKSRARRDIEMDSAYEPPIADDDDNDEDDDEEDDAREERDEDFVSSGLDDDDDDDDVSSEPAAEDDNRRQSGRARKTVRPFSFGKRRDEATDDGDDDDNDDFEIAARPRGTTGRATPRARASRKRKAPASSATSRSTQRRSKQRASVDSSEEADDSEASSSEEEEEEEEEEASSVPAKRGKRGRGRPPPTSESTKHSLHAGYESEDENAFVIGKILAREVHTIKEWRRLRMNRSTRFLSSGSIFVEDEPAESVETGKVGDEVVVVDLSEGEPGKNTSPENSTKDDAVVVEGTQEVASRASDAVSNGNAAPPNANDDAEEERFLVKWKRLSYIHVSWELEQNLLDVDKNAKGKLQRFREKELLRFVDPDGGGDEYFNPEFRDVDRILDIRDQPGDSFGDDDSGEAHEVDGTKNRRYMLVKWKALPYDEITWERESDIQDDAAVRDYEQRLQRAVNRFHRLQSNGNSRKSKANTRKVTAFRGYSATNRPPFRPEQQLNLRDYQVTGVNWMLFNWYQNRNSMLADEMGLGKTLQTATFINHIAVVEERPGPYLVIAPLSTLAHWQREFTNWTTLNAVVYHGSADARAKIQDYEVYLTEDEIEKHQNGARRPKPNSKAPQCYRFDVLITTYEMCATPDFARLSNRIVWELVAVDEAHRLKNRNSKLSVILRKNISYSHILLLTGTPLQNNVEELWTLLNFLDPHRFDSTEDFLESYGELKDLSQVEKLHAELKPFLLRRMKEDVEKTLAPKEETIIEVELTVLQKQYYRAIYEQNTEFLARGMKRSHAPSLMNVLMELRKCCNHPFLIKGAEQREIARIMKQKESTQADRDREAVELLVTSSGKLVLLDKLLPRLQEGGHRVLIFSQFKIMLDILQDYLRLRAYRCERIDGNITGNDRQAAIDRFCDPASSAFIMLLSTRAGGVGINLTAADTVIIYDSDWNPQNDLQAQARCHRIGQTKSVKIYRLLTAKTYELHMFHRASMKLGLDQAVLGTIRDKSIGAPSTTSATRNSNVAMNKEEIENLLKHGAYEMFKEEKEGEAEAASKRFSEESIDHILSRSTKIIHDPKADSSEDGSAKRSLMSSFSKATFVSSSNPDEQVALDDPDFWTKVVGLQAPQTATEPSPLKKRRCRRDVKSYLQQEQEFSGDDVGTKPIGGKKRTGKKQKDEEFVVSSESSDDDDTDDLVDEEFEEGRKKKHKPSLPNIYVYKNLVMLALQAYGYGRFDEMVSRYPLLASYPRSALQEFTVHYLANEIQIASTSSIQAKVLQRRQQQLATPAPGNSVGASSLPTQPKAHVAAVTERDILKWTDEFAKRFLFVERMLKDVAARTLSEIKIPSIFSRSDATKSERAANLFLQQVERMFQLEQFVKKQVESPVRMVELIRDFQSIGDNDRVQKMISDGILPPIRATRNKSPLKPPAKAKPTNGSLVQTAQQNSDSKQPAHLQQSSKASTLKETEDTDASTQIASEGVTTSNNESSPPATESKKSPPPAIAVPESESKGEAEGASKASSPTEATFSSTSTIEQTQEENGDAVPGSAAPTMISDESRQKTLVRLQNLPLISDTTAVAPWWLSTVDDVLLLLLVYKGGWIQTTKVIPSDILKSSLFGTRAAQHDAQLWPSVTVLNRRARHLISTWTNKRRLRLHASSIALRQEIKAARENQEAVKLPPLATAIHSASSNQNTTSFADTTSHHQRTAVHPDNAGSHRIMHEGTVHSSPYFPTKIRFARHIFAFGIPDTSSCTSDADRNEKWRYVLEDPQLSDLRRFPLGDLQNEAKYLERFCRLHLNMEVDPKLHPVPPTFGGRTVRSLLGGDPMEWSLSTTQCQRLVQRIDLFRVLRTKLLMLPPKHLIDVVSHVVMRFGTERENSRPLMPEWWHSPNHDILLLQGVECYGLDNHVQQLWQLPLFKASNNSGKFPTPTWVENYVRLLAQRCKEIIKRAKEQRMQQTGRTVDESTAPGAPQQRHRGRDFPESEVRQRVRDIHGMRMEDPHIVPAVRRRYLQDRKDFAAKVAKSRHIAARAEAQSVMVMLRESRYMKLEDPYYSSRVRAVWLKQIREERFGFRASDVLQEINTQPAAPRDAVIEVDDTPPEATPRSESPDTVGRVNGSHAAPSEETDRISPQKTTAESDATTTSLPDQPSSAASSDAGTTGQKRKRQPRAWEVIVIDDSEDDDDEDASSFRRPRRTTRNRRRRRNEILQDGL